VASSTNRGRAGRSRPRSPATIAALIGGAALILLVGIKYLVDGRSARAPESGRGRDPAAAVLMAALKPLGIAPRLIEREVLAVVGTGERDCERWAVPVPSGVSLVQVNLAVTEAAPRVGLEVLDAWEEPGEQGSQLTMWLGRGATGIPGRNREDRRYRLEFAARDSLAAGRGALAFLVGGFGPTWDETGEAFLGFSVPISVAVLPGYRGSGKIAAAARANGVEVLLHLPMEPERYPQVEPGPGAILMHLTPAEMRARIRRGLKEIGPVVGIASYMGSRAATDPEIAEIVLDETGRQGLFFVDNGVTSRSVLASVARRLGTPCLRSEIILEAGREAKAVKALGRQLAGAMKLAEEGRDVVVIGRGDADTYAALRAALPELKRRKIAVVPVSRLLTADLELEAAAREAQFSGASGASGGSGGSGGSSARR
jgi:uncharacterized protein